MPKINILLGTKAQLIKMAPVMKELELLATPYNYVFLGQHYETLEELHRNFKIKTPDYFVNNKEDVTGKRQMLFWIAKVFCKLALNRKEIFKNHKKDDIYIVHGDTFSTIIGAIAGKLLRGKVVHIESGLRSFNLLHPFPEEIVRIATTHLSDIYYCPDDWAAQNLSKHRGVKINTTANTIYDSLQLAIHETKNCPSKTTTEKPFSVCTIHRFENIFNEKRLNFIINEVIKISKDIRIIFILHAPTKKQLSKTGLITKLQKEANIELRPRYDYFTFNQLLYHSEFIISDGGSNQEECYYLGKPCLILRAKSERNEGIGKNAVLSDYNPQIISQFINNYKDLITPPITLATTPSKIISIDLKERFKAS